MGITSRVDYALGCSGPRPVSPLSRGPLRSSGPRAESLLMQLRDHEGSVLNWFERAMSGQKDEQYHAASL